MYHCFQVATIPITTSITLSLWRRDTRFLLGSHPAIASRSGFAGFRATCLNYRRSFPEAGDHRRSFSLPDLRFILGDHINPFAEDKHIINSRPNKTVIPVYQGKKSSSSTYTWRLPSLHVCRKPCLSPNNLAIVAARPSNRCCWTNSSASVFIDHPPRFRGNTGKQIFPAI